MKKFAFLAVAIALLSLSASESKAALQLRLTDGTTTVTIIDDMAGDLQGTTPDAITWVGTVGNFTLNVSTGVSDGVIGVNQMDLNSINNSSGAGGTLDILLTDDGFSAPGYKFDIGGTTQGTVLAGVFEGVNGTPFDLGTLLAFQGPFTGGAFSGTSQGPTSGSPHQVTILVEITHGSGLKTTSFDAAIAPIPEPATAVMFGLGALGMIGYAVRRRRSA